MGQELFLCFYRLFSLRTICIWKKKTEQNNPWCLGYGVLLPLPNLLCQLSLSTARRRDCRPWLLGKTSSSSLWTVPRRRGKTSWKGKENQKTGNILRLLKVLLQSSLMAQWPNGWVQACSGSLCCVFVGKTLDSHRTCLIVLYKWVLPHL